MINKNNYREYIVFGANSSGYYAVKYINKYTKGKVVSVCDNDEKKKNTTLNGVNVLLPEEAIRKYSQAYIIIASDIYYDEIKNQVLEMGIEEENIDKFLIQDYFENISTDEFPQELEDWYLDKTEKALDLDNPRTFCEKMQWCKLYEPMGNKPFLADKCRVRKWIEDKIGGEYLVPSLGEWDCFEDINFDVLPDKFVLKMNHGSYMNAVVTDKSKIDYGILKRKFDAWKKVNYAYSSGFELQYSSIKPKIIAEEYMENVSGSLYDYKFGCINGKVEYVWIDMERYSDHHTRVVYDGNGKELNVNFQGVPKPDFEYKLPDEFQEMKRIAEKLSKGIRQVRVDLYNVNGKVFFSEMTFTPGSGFIGFEPEEFDLYLGQQWNISDYMQNKKMINIRRNCMKIVVFGIGSYYKKIENVIKERYEIAAFTDNKVTELGETYQGIQLIPPAELKYQDYDKIVIASSYFKQISSQLLKMGISNEKIAIIPAFQQFPEECRMVNLDEKGGCIYSINGISFYASEFCNFADAEEIIIKKGYNF